MRSLLFTPGKAFLSVNSPIVPWTVVFEDEGIAAYFYACDRSRETQDEAILDAMLIYNVSALKEKETERLATIQWSRSGLQAALYLDGTAQALFDFAAHRGHCRLVRTRPRSLRSQPLHRPTSLKRPNAGRAPLRGVLDFVSILPMVGTNRCEAGYEKGAPHLAFEMWVSTEPPWQISTYKNILSTSSQSFTRRNPVTRTLCGDE
jgi:hypothetical protein